MKKTILIFILFNLYYSFFSLSPREEFVSIVNYSSKDIVVSYEFWNGKSEEKYNYIFEQDILGLTLSIRDGLFGEEKYLIRSKTNRIIRIVSYSPSGNFSERAVLFEQMTKIPFENKIKSIYKFLEVKDVNGKMLLTLDTLNDYVIKRQRINGESYYYIEIFDYDFEGRPASEW